MKDKITNLFYALESFRKTKEFSYYGFGEGGPFNFFVHDIQRLKKAKTKKHEDFNKALIDLEQLALRYAIKRGRKDNVTRTLRKEVILYLGINYRPWWKLLLNLK